MEKITEEKLLGNTPPHFIDECNCDKTIREIAEIHRKNGVIIENDDLETFILEEMDRYFPSKE